MRVLRTALTLSVLMEMTQAFTCKPFHTPRSEMAATKYWQAILLLAIVGILVHFSLLVCMWCEMHTDTKLRRES